MRPDFQLSGTEKLTEVYAPASQLTRRHRSAKRNRKLHEANIPGSEVGGGAADIEVGEHLE